MCSQKKKQTTTQTKKNTTLSKWGGKFGRKAGSNRKMTMKVLCE